MATGTSGICLFSPDCQEMGLPANIAKKVSSSTNVHVKTGGALWLLPRPLVSGQRSVCRALPGRGLKAQRRKTVRESPDLSLFPAWHRRMQNARDAVFQSWGHRWKRAP